MSIQRPYGWDVLKVLVVLALLAFGSLHLFVGLSAAQAGTPTPTPNVSDVAPYYADEDASVDNGTWLDNRSEPTLANVSAIALRTRGFFIGTGDPVPGGVGIAGPVLFGIIVAGVLLGPATETGLGPVAGATLAVTILFGIVAAAIAPVWLVPVGLFVIGLVATVVIIRALR